MDDVLVDRIDSACGADLVLPESPIAKHASGGRLTGDDLSGATQEILQLVILKLTAQGLHLKGLFPALTSL